MHLEFIVVFVFCIFCGLRFRKKQPNTKKGVSFSHSLAFGHLPETLRAVGLWGKGWKRVYGVPVAQKALAFFEGTLKLYMETKIRSPKGAGFFGYR